jgi:hypothetical protein
MMPAGPEATLAAIVAQVRTAPRELHGGGTEPAPVVVASMIDQLPAEPVGVEVADDRSGRGRGGDAVSTIRDALDVDEFGAACERRREASHRSAPSPRIAAT